MSALLRRERPAPEAIPPRALDFLRALGGPTALHVPGRDASRRRVATTLMHGNEPSGLRAFHAWLREGCQPAVDTWLVIAHVEAALREPPFSHRALPGRRDLNRCFLGPFEDAEGELAASLLELLREVAPEALVDLHNNTGHNPPYGVGLEASADALALTALFGRRFVRSHLQLGALMEAVDGMPAVTVEVGRAGDPRADEVARAGLARFLERASLAPASDGAPAVQVLEMPMRVELRPGARVEVADRPDRSAHLTLATDVDRHNFEELPAGTVIGWIRGEELPVRLVDESGADRAEEWFAVRAGRLETRRPLVPIMITTDPVIAASDCLFYVVREHDRSRGT